MTRRLRHGIAGLALTGGMSLGVLLLPRTAISAHDRAAEAPQAGLALDGQRLEGTWLVTISRPADRPPGVPPTFLSLVTFLPTGEFLEESNTAAIRSLGHGDWVRRGDRRFTRHSLSFRFDASRTFIGFNRITADMRLNRRGDEYVAEATIETFDAAGQPLSTAQSTEAGRRCGVSTSMARCLGLE